MAGGAGTYAVDGVSYSTVGAAIAQLISDEDGNATTATQNIVLSIDPTETVVTMPTSAQVNTSRTYQIVIKSSNSGSPQTWTTTNGTFVRATPSPHFTVQDLTISNTGGTYFMTYSNFADDCRPITIQDCTITNSATHFVNSRYSFQICYTRCSIQTSGNLYNQTSTGWGTISYLDCDLDVAANVQYGSYAGKLIMRRCGVKCGDSDYVCDMGLANDNTVIDFADSTFYITNTPVMFYFNTTVPQRMSMPQIRNCIIDGATGLLNMSNGYPNYTCAQLYGNNIWSNKAAGTFIDTASSDDDVADLAAFQALGYEIGSASENVTFASTTWGNANFLKLSGSVTNQANNSGWYADAFSTKRENYQYIDPGWHQYSEQAAPTTPTFAGITSLSDNGDGTLVAQWATATSATHYEISIHTSSMSAGDLNARTYISAAVDDTGASSYSFDVSRLSNGSDLTSGTTYYVAVLARNGGTGDGGSTNLSAAVTNPNEVGGPFVVIPDETPVQLATTATDIYEVPAGKRAVTLEIVLCNTDSSARTVSLYKVQSGDSAADDVAFVKSLSLGAAGAIDHTWNEPIKLTLTAGTKIQGIADVAAKVTAHVGVVEITPS